MVIMVMALMVVRIPTDPQITRPAMLNMISATAEAIIKLVMGTAMITRLVITIAAAIIIRLVMATITRLFIRPAMITARNLPLTPAIITRVVMAVVIIISKTNPVIMGDFKRRRSTTSAWSISGRLEPWQPEPSDCMKSMR